MNVWLNGSFDVLHSGHIKLFKIARVLAGQNGAVWVGTDTDERITSKKVLPVQLITLKIE